MTKRAREANTVQDRVDRLLQDRAAAHVVWTTATLSEHSEINRKVLDYVAGGVALVALRAGTPYPPLVGTVEVMLTLEETCIRVVCGVGERNAFSDRTLVRIKRQDPTCVGKTEFVTANGQTNIGFVVALGQKYIVPDEEGDDQVVGVADVLHEHELAGLRDTPLRAYPSAPDI